MAFPRIDPDRIYTILPNDFRFIFCGTIRSKQVAVANTSGRLITFSATGEIETLEPIKLSNKNGSKISLVSWLKKKKFKPEPIHVKQFLIDDGTIGIEPLPDYLKEFMEHPFLFGKLEQKELREQLEWWIPNGMYILNWGEYFHCDPSGEIVST